MRPARRAVPVALPSASWDQHLVAALDSRSGGGQSGKVANSKVKREPLARPHQGVLSCARFRTIPGKPFRPVARLAIPLWKGGPAATSRRLAKRTVGKPCKHFQGRVMSVLNLFRRLFRPVPGTRPSFRPRLRALEGRVGRSATTYDVVPLTGKAFEEFSVDAQHHLLEKKNDGSHIGAYHSVPGTENWRAWDVRAVRDSQGNVDMLVNGTDGHLWERTEFANGSRSAWTANEAYV